MRSLSRCALIGFIALLVLLPLHEMVDPGEEWPFDDEVVVVLYSVLFIAAVTLRCRASADHLFTLVRAAARNRFGLNGRIRHSAVADIDPPRDESLPLLVLCQFRI
jgi:hypothetical protein